MKVEGFRNDVNVRLTVTKAEVAHWSRLAKQHYDDRCQGAAGPGGFIYGWSNRFDAEDPDDESAEVEASARMMGMLCKIAEGHRGIVFAKDSGFAFEVRRALADMAEESERINGGLG